MFALAYAAGHYGFKTFEGFLSSEKTSKDVLGKDWTSTLIPLATPQQMLGRVTAVEMLFIGASNELGEFESGVTAAWFGTVPAVVIGGIGTLGVVGIWMWLFPDLRKVDKLEDVKPQS